MPYNTAFELTEWNKGITGKNEGQVLQSNIKTCSAARRQQPLSAVTSCLFTAI